jgi:hypothetical protein
MLLQQTLTILLMIFCKGLMILQKNMDGELTSHGLGAMLILYIDPLCSTVEYIKSLAGLMGYKKLTKGAITAFGAFCDKKLEKVNKGVFFATITEGL